MRNIDEINNTIVNWNGTFTELVNEFSIGEYHVLYEEGCLEYADAENCYNNGDYADMLYVFIGDWLMSNIVDGYPSKATNNLFRLWNEG
jgi:hypothetical protein